MRRFEHDEGFFFSKDNLRLFWESSLPSSPSAHVAIVHGYADHSGRYRSLTEALVGRGFGVHAFDYRGHGQSDGRRGFCDSFDDYLDDLTGFLDRVAARAAGRPCFLFAQSHGALLAVQWVARRKQTELAGLILSAPWLRMAVEPPTLKVWGARAVGVLVPWLPMSGLPPAEELTADPDELRKVRADPLYNRNVTPRWFSEARRAQDEALTFGPRLLLPTLLLLPGQDRVSSSPTSRAFFQTVAASDKRLVEYTQARHEPHNDVARATVWKDISGWISEHL